MKLQETDFVGKWLNVTAHRLSYLVNRKLNANGFQLTHEQMVLLKIISCNQGISQKELASRLDRDKTSIARSLNNLEKSHKVVRINVGNDKRVNNLFLTKDGHQLLTEIQPVIQELTNELMKIFEEKEIKALHQTLQKLINEVNTIEEKLHTQQKKLNHQLKSI
jgi:DNA-binding MarR family transcriptional regulator